MLKALIVDDEKKSRESLKILIEDFCENVQVVALAGAVDEALQVVNNSKIDIVFLDIRMNRETGFDFLNQIKNINFEVIFTTAYSEYALDAIKFSAMDYLLKPINIDQLKEAIAKVEKKAGIMNVREQLDWLMHNFKVESSDNYKLALPTSEGFVFINIKDIVYCEAESNYTCFYIKDNKKLLVSKTLKEYEDLLSAHHFFRIHHSYLINLKEIKRYIKGEGGYVVMSNDVSLDVSKRKKEIFLHRIATHKMF